MMSSASPTQRRESEEGAVAIVVAILMVVFVGAVALTLDLGSAWETQRDLVADTDAGAMAGARLLAQQGIDNCGQSVVQNLVRSEVETVVGLNDEDSGVGPIDVECQGSYATVRVEAEKPSISAFGPALGVDEIVPGSASTSLVGPASSAEGLIPMALCSELPAIAGYLAGGERDVGLRGTDPRYPSSRESSPTTDYAVMGAGLVHAVPWEKQLAGDCGDASGNWGWLSFHNKAVGTGNCNNGSTLSDLRAMICDGYSGGVDLGTPPGFADKHCGIVDPNEIGNADSKEEAVCWGRTGQTSGLAQLETSWLCTSSTQNCRNTGKVFSVVIFDNVVDESGTSAKFRPVAFLGLILRDVVKEKGSGGDHTLHLEFTSAQVRGGVGRVQFDTGVTAFEMCGAGDFENCTP